MQAVVAASAALDTARLASRDAADAALRAAIPDAAVRGFVLQNLVPRAEGGYGWRVNLAAIVASLPGFAGFQPPAAAPPSPLPVVNFVAGERSRYLRPHHHAAVRALFPGAEIHTVAGAGHWVHSEKPAATLALLEKFISNS